jgi:hypothetical protein
MLFRATLLVAALALPVAAQQSEPFNWSGRVPAGRWIRIRDLSGSITVGAATGDNVEVIATKRWRRGDPTTVRIETKKFGPNDESVLICALWGSRSSCDEHSYESHTDGNDRGMRNNDVNVDFRVLVPRGVKVGVSTINGTLTVDGATAEVDARTINGDIDVTTSGGPVNATNVNGNVRARLGKVESDGTMDFRTITGNVSVEFGNEVGADVDLNTVNGSLNTNFEMTIRGRIDPKRLRTHIGRPGGPRIRISTVNGNVELTHR